MVTFAFKDLLDLVVFAGVVIVMWISWVWYVAYLELVSLDFVFDVAFRLVYLCCRLTLRAVFIVAVV